MGIVSITFDEGRKSQFEKVFPVLEKEGFKATVYLLTGFIGKSWSIQNLRTRIINKKQVKRLIKNGWEIASHTSNHSNLVFASERRARKEFEHSKKRLDEMRIEKSGIAYPGGVISQKNYKVAQRFFTYGREASNSIWQDLKVLDLDNLKEIDRFRLRGNVISENCVDGLNLEKYFKEISHQNKWVILVFHEIEEKVINKDDSISLIYFAEIIQLIKKYNLKVKTVAEVMKEYQLPVLEDSLDKFETMADYAERNFGKKWLSLPLFICYRLSLLEKTLNFVLKINELNPLYWFIKDGNKDFDVEETMKYYDRYYSDSQGYHLQEWRKSYLERMFKCLKVDKDLRKNKRKRFLDVGTGVGVTVIECAKRNLLSYGVDFSPVAIQKAEILADQQLSKKQRKLVNFRIASAEKLPFPNNYFDKICSIAVLEYVKNDQRAIDEIQRVVKPGGRIFILTSNKRSLFFSLIESWMERKSAHKLRNYEAKDLINEFKKRDFVLEDLAFHGRWPKVIQFFLQKILPTSEKLGYRIWWYLERRDINLKTNPLVFTFSISMVKK